MDIGDDKVASSIMGHSSNTGFFLKEYRILIKIGGLTPLIRRKHKKIRRFIPLRFSYSYSMKPLVNRVYMH